MNPWDNVGNQPLYNNQGFVNGLGPQIQQNTQNAYSDSAYAQSQQSVGQQNLSNLQNQQQSIQGMDSSYPAMANSYGLGTQPASTSQVNPNQSGVADTSRGFNPWSLSGEAMAR